MSFEVSVFEGLKSIEHAPYEKFQKSVGASVFYSWELLNAVEQFPLLPTLKTFYIVVKHKDDIVGFLPLYLQKNVDTFKVLSQSTNYDFSADTKALFSHIMHVSDSRILAAKGHENIVIEKILSSLKAIRQKEQIECCGVLNIDTHSLSYPLDIFSKHEYKINPMWNRFRTEIAPHSSLDEIIAKLPRHGRQEVNRQIRKYNATDSSAKWYNIRDADLEAVVDLIHQTTDKYGTGAYYPKGPMYNFLKSCDAIATVLEIKHGEQRVAAGIVFLDHDTLHFWALGVDYSLTEYSPYTMLYVNLYQYALQHNYKIIEAGRTTQAIKERLGFSPVPLQSIINFNSATENAKNV
ncbi:GNAT family N-acetyltransferase [Caedibacter taeniospiralis]|uniref:GNAT family N-acetyltransferase n=1 Tax=Caedibacter taeniospiralis TaxID=28907 RepID=UPI001302326B|nr:GNAT family N-acetyltransferase [Caedibacter taeniospiralis]